MPREKRTVPDASFLLHAAAAWFLSACLLLCLTTLIANLTQMGEQGIGYLSSLCSFLCAAAAGIAAARRSGTSRFLTALLTATALVILLLTVGFLAEGQKLDPSSVLSVVSFSYAGALLGSILAVKPGKRAGRHRFSVNT